MGIQGLLPLLKSIHQQVEPKDYRGKTVAIDSYCWLHKGVYACAYELGIGRSSTVYVNYCIKRLKMLLFNNITPIMVFDGRNLPMKADKEKERRDNRQKNRAAANEHMRKGNRAKATECFQRCMDITPEMARAVIQACYELGVQCIVAPYEADSQLAYLFQSGAADMVISEDSDLLAFGCSKVLFKMDAYGCGTLVDASTFGDASSVDLSSFTMDDFRHMCILSGCDYLPSVNGVGLQTAAKLLKRCQKDPSKVIATLRLDASKRVPSDYEQRFWLAEFTFLHQIVYDPETKQTRHLKPITEKSRALCEDWSFLGTHNEPEKAALIAGGELTLEGKEIKGLVLNKTASKQQSYRYTEPEAPMAITAMLPKASSRFAATGNQQQSLHQSKPRPSVFGKALRQEAVQSQSRGNDCAVLGGYGIASQVSSAWFAAESRHHQRQSSSSLAVKRPSSPLRDSLGEQVLTDEENSMTQSLSDVESEEPLTSSSFSHRRELVTTTSTVSCTRISKFFAAAGNPGPSSSNTISAMLQQAQHKVVEDRGVVGSGRYEPPVAAPAVSLTPRSRPKALSSSWHSATQGQHHTQNQKREEKKTQAGRGGSLSMFSYVSKRRSTEVSLTSVTTSDPASLEDPEEVLPPAAKMRRLSEGQDVLTVLSDVEINASETRGPFSDHPLSPIITGHLGKDNVTVLSSSMPALPCRDVENLPPKPRLGGRSPHPSVSQPVTYKPTPGKKLLAAAKRKGNSNSAKRLGVGRPTSTSSDIRGFLPGCLDQFRRKCRPAVLINVDDDEAEANSKSPLSVGSDESLASAIAAS